MQARVIQIMTQGWGAEKAIKNNVACHGPTECYNCMCEARRKASSDKALLLFLVTCMHDAMHAVCMLCAIWRTRDIVICGTE